MIDGVIHGLHDLPLPLGGLLLSVEHVVHVHRPVEVPGPQPLEKHGVGVLAGEVDDDGLAGGPHVGLDDQGLAGLTLVLQGVGPDPDSVLGIGL